MNMKWLLISVIVMGMLSLPLSAQNAASSYVEADVYRDVYVPDSN